MHPGNRNRQAAADRRIVPKSLVVQVLIANRWLPKRAAKLVRFNHAVNRLGAGADRGAAESGYADQSHRHRNVVAECPGDRGPRAMPAVADIA